MQRGTSKFGPFNATVTFVHGEERLRFLTDQILALFAEIWNDDTNVLLPPSIAFTGRISETFLAPYYRLPDPSDEYANAQDTDDVIDHAEEKRVRILFLGILGAANSERDKRENNHPNNEGVDTVRPDMGGGGGVRESG